MLPRNMSPAQPPHSPSPSCPVVLISFTCTLKVISTWTSSQSWDQLDTPPSPSLTSVIIQGLLFLETLKLLWAEL